MIPALLIDLIRFLGNKFLGVSAEKGLKKNPENVHLLLKMAVRSLKKGDYQDSIDYFIRINKLEEGNKTAMFYIGLLSLRLKDYEKSISFYSKYLKNPIIKPKDTIEIEIYNLLPETYYYLGYCYLKLGDKDSSENFKNMAISKDNKIMKLKLY